MLLRFWIVAAFTFTLLEISWAKAGFLVLKRVAYSALFGAIVWSADRFLALFSLSAGLRLAELVLFSAVLLGWAIWSAGSVVFGRHAVEFLLTYASHLPARYVQQLRSQARDTHNTSSAQLRATR
jgi:hypothetical protein